MPYLSKNNAYSVLAGAISAIQTTISLQTGNGDRFPVIAAPDYTFITLEDAAGNIEICKVTARAEASDILTVIRAQEGTTAIAWASGVIVELRMTAELVRMTVAHPDSAANAHTAAVISNAPAGNIIATTVQAALNYLDSAIFGHKTNASGAHAASAISVTAGGTLASTDVQNALLELDNEKTTAALAAAAASTLISSAIATAIAAALPGGIITKWHGSIASIPAGWYLCDGTNGTPNLTDRFVIGAGSAYAVGATGGSKDAVVVSHSHGVTDPGHAHNNQAGVQEGGGGGVATGTTIGIGSKNTSTSATGISINSTGVSAVNANLPPYYALCYIMRA